MASDPKPRFLRKSKISLPPTVHVNKEFLKSATGILKIGESVTLITAGVSLAQYVTLKSTVTAVNCFFFAAVVSLWLLAFGLFLLFLFQYHEKVTCRRRTWSAVLAAFSGVAAELLLIASILLACEAAEVSQRFSRAHSIEEKCVTCSKVNTAAVFGFLSWILFAVDLLFFLRHYGSIDGRVARIRVQHLSPGDAGNDDELDV